VLRCQLWGIFIAVREGWSLIKDMKVLRSLASRQRDCGKKLGRVRFGRKHSSSELLSIIHARFEESPCREAIHPVLLQQIHAFVRQHTVDICEVVDTISEQVPDDADLSYRLAIAELALAAGRFKTARDVLTPVYAQHNFDFRFQDSWWRREYYEKAGLPSLDKIGYERRGYLCPYAFSKILVESTGAIVPCCGPMVSQPFGKLPESSVCAVMNSEFANAMRDSILDGSYRFCAKLHCPVFRNELRPADDQESEPLLKGLDLYRHRDTEMWPRFVELALDRTCNLACTFCRKERIVEPQHAVEWWKSLLEHDLDPVLKRADCVVFAGTGDPFASGVYRALMARLNRRDYPDLCIILLTNGLLLTPQVWEEYSHLSGMLACLSVSIDAASPEVYAKLRMGGDFERLQRNLKFFKELRQCGAVKELKLNFLVQRENFREMKAFYDMAVALDADVIHYQQLANIEQSDPDGTFQEKRVDLPFHNDHAAFCEILKSSFMKDPRVQSGFEHIVPTL
jgi:molybdenum cofactor biosynthesis enzyme MoaA